MEKTPRPDHVPASHFESTAREETATPLMVELWLFLRHNRKWWLAPFLLILVAVGGLLLLSATAAAPFIYTLF